MNVVVIGHPSNFQIVKQIPKLSRNMLENVKHAKKEKEKKRRKKNVTGSIMSTANMSSSIFSNVQHLSLSSS